MVQVSFSKGKNEILIKSVTGGAQMPMKNK